MYFIGGRNQSPKFGTKFSLQLHLLALFGVSIFDLPVHFQGDPMHLEAQALTSKCKLTYQANLAVREPETRAPQQKKATREAKGRTQSEEVVE